MIEELWLIPLGFVAGILGSIIGLGGGIIIVPVLTFMGFSPTLAVSNSNSLNLMKPKFLIQLSIYVKL